MYKAITFFLWQSAPPIVVTYNSASFVKFSQKKIRSYLDEILIFLKLKKITISPSPKLSISQCLQERCDCRNHINSIESHPIEDRELFTFDNSDQLVDRRLQEETTALELIQEFHHSGTQRYTKEICILNTNISSKGNFLWFKTQLSYL